MLGSVIFLTISVLALCTAALLARHQSRVRLARPRRSAV